MKKISFALFVCVAVALSAGAEVYFEDNFDTGGTAGAVSRGWQFTENEYVTEVGSHFIVAPDWPEGQDGPGTDTGFTSPPKADGTASEGGFLIADSDAGSGSDDIGSLSEIWAITPSFDTSGASGVWFHADVEIDSNNNGECVFVFAASADGGATWIPFIELYEPQRPEKGFSNDIDGTIYRIQGVEHGGSYPELGSGSLTRSFDGLHGRIHYQLPAEVANQSDVKILMGYFEPADAWWFTVDNLVIDNVPPPMGSEVVLSEDFENGIPADWTNTPLGINQIDQIWDVRAIWDEDYDEPYKLNDTLGYVDIDILNMAEWWGMEIDLSAPDEAINPSGALDGRWLMMLAGQGYAMWQEGDFEGEGGTLDTPALDMSNATAVYIAFDSEVLVGNSASRYEVYYSADGGANFERIFTYHEALMNYEEAPYFTRHYLEAPAAAGSGDVIFRFSAVNAADPGEMEGFWVIDNVQVTTDVTTSVVDWALF